MKEIPIPAPSDKETVKKIINLVDDLEPKSFDLAAKDRLQEMEERLQILVDKALAAAQA